MKCQEYANSNTRKGWIIPITQLLIQIYSFWLEFVFLTQLQQWSGSEYEWNFTNWEGGTWKPISMHLEETFFSDKFVFWSLEFTPPMINDRTKIEFVFELATRHDFNYVSICLGICLNLDLFSFYPSWYTS